MKWEQCLFSIQHFELPMPRKGTFSFPVPSYLTEIPAVFRKAISSSQEFLFLETYAIQPLDFRPIWSSNQKFWVLMFSLCLQWLSKVFEGNVWALPQLLVNLFIKISEKICVSDYFSCFEFTRPARVFWKGQLISKCLFGVFNSPKKWTKIIRLEVP